MSYQSPVSDKFQAVFNKAASKKNLSGKPLEAYAVKFFQTVLQKIVKEEADHCPFPEYLAQNFKKV